jgi:hypothetical protein
MLIALLGLGCIASMRALSGRVDQTTGVIGAHVIAMAAYGGTAFAAEQRPSGSLSAVESRALLESPQPPRMKDFKDLPDWKPKHIAEVHEDDRNIFGDVLDWVMDTVTGHEIQDHAGTVLSAADQAGIDPRALFAVLAHESDGRQRVGASRLDHLNILLGRGSIGMGQMQRDTFAQTAVKHPEVLGRSVSPEQARNEWPRLRDHDELAIRATAYHLRDLMDQLPPGISEADRHRMAAVGYNIGADKMLKQVARGELGYDESKSYAKTFDERFNEADHFFCKDGERFSCESR